MYFYAKKNGVDLKAHYDAMLDGYIIGVRKSLNEQHNYALSTYVHKEITWQLGTEARRLTKKQYIPENKITSLDLLVENHTEPPSNFSLEDYVVDKIFIEQLLHSLSPPERKITILLLQGKTPKEIRESQGCTYNKIMKTISNLRRKLKKEGMLNDG